MIKGNFSTLTMVELQAWVKGQMFAGLQMRCIISIIAITQTIIQQTRIRPGVEKQPKISLLKYTIDLETEAHGKPIVGSYPLTK